MEFFKWKDSFSIGINELDRQHQSFLDCLNDCHSMVGNNKLASAYPALIQRLRKYATEHFRFEEALMRKFGYKELERQEKQHLYFVAQISELEAAQAKGNDTSVQSVMSFLRDWFLEHILTQDKAFASYVRAAKRKLASGR